MLSQKEPPENRVPEWVIGVSALITVADKCLLYSEPTELPPGHEMTRSAKNPIAGIVLTPEFAAICTFLLDTPSYLQGMLADTSSQRLGIAPSFRRCWQTHATGSVECLP